MGMKDAGISFRPPSNGTLPPNYVADVIEQLAPTMDDLSKLGLINKSYVYGFDEMPEIYNQSVYDIFGGLKKKWPSLTTMAVLDWETFPSDLPLDSAASSGLARLASQLEPCASTLGTQWPVPRLSSPSSTPRTPGPSDASSSRALMFLGLSPGAHGSRTHSLAGAASS